MIFDVPVRIRWDADPPASMVGMDDSYRNIPAIFDAIVDTSPLSLDITVESPDILDRMLSLLEGMDAPIEVSLFLSESIVKMGVQGTGEGSSHFRALYHGANCGDIDEEFFWFAPDPADYRETFDVLGNFYRSGGKLLLLRNLNARKGGLPGAIPEPDFEGFMKRGAFLPMKVDDEKSVIIHDYFLWRFFRENYPDITDKRAEFDGCQGGNTLGYVDWDGVVYPCETLLTPLGRIPGKTIQDIWNSPGRKTISQRILEMPAECTGCDELTGCFGGCRGLSYHVLEGFEYPDPQCRK